MLLLELIVLDTCLIGDVPGGFLGVLLAPFARGCLCLGFARRSFLGH